MLTYAKAPHTGYILVNTFPKDRQYFIYQEAEDTGYWKQISLEHPHPILRNHRLWWKPIREEPTWIKRESLITLRGREGKSKRRTLDRNEKGKVRSALPMYVIPEGP